MDNFNANVMAFFGFIIIISCIVSLIKRGAQLFTNIEENQKHMYKEIRESRWKIDVLIEKAQKFSFILPELKVENFNKKHTSRFEELTRKKMERDFEVKVRKISERKDHPNADRLAIYKIEGMGWEIVSGIDTWKVGDLAIYLPPDSDIPLEIAGKWEIEKYCGRVKGEPDRRRIKACRIRDQRSFGTLQKPEEGMIDGQDVTDFYDIKKWEPAPNIDGGEGHEDVAVFEKYTKIENYQNVPDTFDNHEKIVVEEKIHGSNCRVGIIDGEKIAGSHNLTRNRTCKNGKESVYWKPFSHEGVNKLLEQFSTDGKNAILYCEIFGPGIQDMDYGRKEVDFVVYDIKLDGEYLSFALRTSLCELYGIPMPPVLYEGEFFEVMKEKICAEGSTKLAKPEDIKCKFKGREGIVIRNKSEIERKIVKIISIDYHDRKNSNRTEGH